MRVSTRGSLVCALAVVAVLFAGCVTPAPDTTVRLGEAADNTEVRLAPGQTVEIALPGNLTTGFDWMRDGALPSQLTTVTDSYKTDPNSAGAAGAGGVHTFVYKGAKAGTGTLRLQYARSFEKDVPPAKIFTLTVVVK